LKAILRSQAYILTFVAVGGHEKGVLPLLDAIINLMPSLQKPRPWPRAKTGKRNQRHRFRAAGLVRLEDHADPFVGKLTYFRIYSGTLHGDTRIWNQNKSAEERMAGLSLIRGQGDHAGQDRAQRRYRHRGQAERYHHR